MNTKTTVTFVWGSPAAHRVFSWRILCAQSHFHDCENWESSLLERGLTAGCKIFTHEMAQTASTVSLSILVTIEMLNAFNR